MKLTNTQLRQIIKEELKEALGEYPNSEKYFEKIKTFMLDRENYGLGLSLFDSIEGQDVLRPDQEDALKRITMFANLFHETKSIFDELKNLSPEDPSYRKKRLELRKKRARQKSQLQDLFEELFGIQSNLGREVKRAFQEIMVF